MTFVYIKGNEAVSINALAEQVVKLHLIFPPGSQIFRKMI